MKDLYRNLCRETNCIPVFSQDWWLDATCGANHWDVSVIEKDAKVVAALPYLTRKRFGKTILGQPSLTQKLGPWISYPNDIKPAKKIGLENELMTQLIENLPSFARFQQAFDHSITNWLPFYWQGFTQSTNYTYIIENISHPENVLANFSHAKRKDVKKARAQLTVHFDLPAEEFYEHHVFTLGQQGKHISYGKELFTRIFDACYGQNAGRTIYAVDEQSKIHSALFVVWDTNSAYNLISTIDQDHRSSGATTLLIYEMIKFLNDKTKSFDFEGSMIQGVEFSFRQFGTVQKPMFQVSKTNSKLFEVIELTRRLIS